MALDAEQEAEDPEVLLARGRGARRRHRAEPADRGTAAAAADTAPPAESRNFLRVSARSMGSGPAW